MIDLILIFVGLFGLIIGTITDFQKREVADWVNYGLLFAGLGIRLIFSIISGDYWFFLIAAIFAVVAYGLGLFMFYTGQWGGGDSKMIIGLAALFATYNTAVLSFAHPILPDFLQNLFNWNFNYNLSFYFHFLINSLLVGGIYGVIWTIFLILKHAKNFRKEFSRRFMDYRLYFIIATSLALIGVIISYFSSVIISILLIAMSLMILVLPWLLALTKSVESACMITLMKIKDLTEGEWIVKDVVINKKRICGPADLGISKEQIEILRDLQKKGKIDAVQVKIGIPFVPAFLIAFIVTIIMGNLAIIMFPI
jgi:Flp pilus assembly protein protease CpaA